MSGRPSPPDARTPPGAVRAALIAGITALHIGVHDAVTALNASRPPEVFHDLSLPIDALIPYLAWTWVVYYFGDLYVIAWGSVVVWRLPSRLFFRAVVVYAVMIVIGAAMHLAIPGRSPWPEEGSVVQQWFHSQVTNDRNVCLPSMHVALALLPSCMTFHVFRTPRPGVVAVVISVLVSIATLTLKEHFVLDVVTGALLALAAYGIWRIPGPVTRSER